jgi:hypothetical protein
MPLELAPTERMIWQGQPAQGFRLSLQDAFAIPFAALWLFIVLVIFGATLSGQATEVSPLTYVMLPIFVLVGLHMLVGRFLVDRAARRKTQYYLTTQRALIETGLFRRAQSSTSLAALPEIKFRAGRRGRGTIQFGAPPGIFGMMPSNWPGARQFFPPTFEDVEDAGRVFKLALDAQREAQVRR